VIPAIECYSVGGVPVVRGDAVADQITACLMFRVGRFDETLPTSGITHMVEHLALAGKIDAPYSFNASVDGRYTSFYMASGDPSHVREFVVDVCSGLSGDQSRVIEHERKILRAEASTRGGAGPLAMCLSERYGTTGPGLTNYQEFGLNQLSWEWVRQWRSHWFTRQNAVLWIAGPWPDDLRVELPAGTPPVPTQLRPLDLGLPGFVIAGRGGIGLSLVGRRSAGWHACVEILQRRLTQVLRHEFGLSYHVEATGDELSYDLTHTWLAADALPDRLAMAAHSMLSTLETLVAGGCTEDELTAYRERLSAARTSPSRVVGMLNRKAQAILNGDAAWAPDRDLGDAAGLTPRAISEIAGELHDGMIVVTPTLLPAVQGRMKRLPAWSASTVTGTQYKAVDSDALLTLGPDGVTLTAEPDHHVTVRFRDAVALLRWNDGKRAVLGADGFAVQLDPDEWPEGELLLNAIASRISPDAAVFIDAPGPRRPGRPPAVASRPGQAGPAKDWQASTPTPPRAPHLPPLSASAWIGRAICIAVVIFGALGLAGGAVTGGAIIVAMGAAGIVWQELARRRGQAS
jgi:zinc protease